MCIRDRHNCVLISTASTVSPSTVQQRRGSYPQTQHRQRHGAKRKKAELFLAGLLDASSQGLSALKPCCCSLGKLCVLALLHQERLVIVVEVALGGLLRFQRLCLSTGLSHCGRSVPVLCVDTCLLYTSDAADEEDSVDLGGRRIIKKKKK
eukprot:TRINITY_DN1626_c0_g1_i2.p1 TRINITY_DN1626_c0_g1~~TRINITY_DN1626_c0_g1_i2.p1  ORF type:complete len:151 (-),score=5.99 TRINITY_DN1626_c0_g1_i2:69-521(-)